MIHAAYIRVAEPGLICAPRRNAGAKWPCMPCFG
jgi:hypothetical protein